jgi:DNA-binding NarL/FixJ family response regulator
MPHYGPVRLRCVIVDDDDDFVVIARAVLEGEDIIVAGVAANGAEAVACARDLRPDVVLIDIRLNGESGFDVARELAADGPTTALIMISTHPYVDFADMVADSPAVGFLPKAGLSAAGVRQLLKID